MPLLIASLLSGLAAIFRSQIGTWIVTAMAWLGIAWATHEFAVQPWIDNMQAQLAGGTPGGQWGSVLMAYAGIMKFDQACTMIASAVVTKFGVSAARAVLVRRV